jgi:hypothetical protein
MLGLLGPYPPINIWPLKHSQIKIFYNKVPKICLTPRIQLPQKMLHENKRKMKWLVSPRHVVLKKKKKTFNIKV